MACARVGSWPSPATGVKWEAPAPTDHGRALPAPPLIPIPRVLRLSKEWRQTPWGRTGRGRRPGGSPRVKEILLSLTVAASMVGLDVRASLAQAAPREARFEGTSFALAWLTSTGTMSFYGAFAMGPAMGLVGVVQNTRANTRVVVVGGGTRVRVTPRGGLTMFAAFADGSGGATLRLYVLPAFRFGPWRLTGNATTYLPLESGGHWKASLDPLTVSLGVTRLVAAGLATVVRREADGGADGGAGPSATLRLGGMTARAELVRMTRSGRLEGRLNVGVAF